jgi:hypothetical protein
VRASPTFEALKMEKWCDEIASERYACRELRTCGPDSKVSK